MQDSENLNAITNGFSENGVHLKEIMNGDINKHPKLNVNHTIVNKFLERLRIRTVPHIKPLIERLEAAEHKNVDALKSIDKINKRIKEIENYVENNMKSKAPKKESATKTVGTDICDPNSQEYNRLINSVSSSTLAPFKPRTSQVRPKNVANTLPDTTNRNPNVMTNPANTEDCKNKMFLLNQPNPHQMVPQMNYTNPPSIPVNINCALPNMTPIGNSLPHHQYPFSFEALASKFLPAGMISSLFSVPKLVSKKVPEGIVLEWNMNIAPSISPSAYQIFSFQKSECTTNFVPWKLVGNTDSLPLPMSCTLNMINRTETYYFIIRASVNDNSYSPWSNMVCIDIRGQ